MAGSGLNITFIFTLRLQTYLTAANCRRYLALDE
jgi:hypothetical protein